MANQEETHGAGLAGLKRLLNHAQEALQLRLIEAEGHYGFDFLAGEPRQRQEADRYLWSDLPSPDERPSSLSNF